jgi:hypothetical protein
METTSSGSQTKKMVSDIKFETLENTSSWAGFAVFSTPLRKLPTFGFWQPRPEIFHYQKQKKGLSY